MQNYHKHSHYSNIILTDSVATNEEYAKRAVELRHGILSSCEHGTQGNVRECAELAAKHGQKWRYVSEAYFVKDRLQKDNTNAHIVLAAKTAKGIGDLNEALSEANISGYYYRPRVDMDILLSLNPKDVFVTTACVGGVFKYGLKDAERIIVELARHFRDSFMLEVQYHNTSKQKEINEFVLRMNAKHGIPLIAGMDSHFILPEDSMLRDLRLEANNIRYEDEAGWMLDYPSDEDTVYRFERQGLLSAAQIKEAMDNTDVFLSFEDVELDRTRKLPTLYPDLTQEQRNQKYLDIVHHEWERFSEGMTAEEKTVREEGIRYETDVITSTNMSDYFLLDYEIVRRAKEKGGVLTKTGRGSAAGFFTNTLLGFSSIDRFSIPVEMYPDRFISADRILSGSLPDQDQNCATEEVFIEAQRAIMGEWRSAPMVAFGTMKRLSAWKMYCRSANVPFGIANTISDQLRNYELAIKHATDDEKDTIVLSDFVSSEYIELARKSEQYLGMIDSISPHPCAHLLCTADIRREIGVIRLNTKTGKKQPVYAAFIDGQTAEKYGYLKNDWQHVNVVTINQSAYERIGIPLPTVNELIEMTRCDPETWRMYAAGLTMGLNQVERDKTREKVMRYKPKNITELAAFVAAVRPSFASMMPMFLSRQRFSYGIPVVDRLIQTREMPNSYILFQEQVMKTLQYGGFTAPESYAAIKAIAKKHPEKVLPLKQRFIEGFTNQILSDDVTCTTEKAIEIVENIWKIVEDATGYSFCAAHAVCVALDSLYSAYAKAHYPLDFYATLLTLYSEKGDKDRIALVKEEMKRGFGIRIAPCRFRQDSRGYFIDRENMTISDALTSVKHIGKRVASTLYEWRERRYTYFIDLLRDMVNNPAFDSTAINILIRMGYFQELGSSGKLLRLYEEFREGDHRYSKTHVAKTQTARLEELRDIERHLHESEIPMEEQIAFEVAHYGTPLSTFSDARGLYAVVEVDDKYSPKLKLYNLANGNMGVMKMKKADFKKEEIKAGDVIKLIGWRKSPAYQYIDGKAVKCEGRYDLWITNCEKLTTGMQTFQ